jgi:metal-dependent amidase/aminoacylase/carboxypeptidase family protein
MSQIEESDLPQLVRTTTRLEEEIDKALRHLCMDEKITKEVWFEAAYLYLAEHPKAMKVVNGVAKERWKRAADLRKLETMQKRLKGSMSLT